MVTTLTNRQFGLSPVEHRGFVCPPLPDQASQASNYASQTSNQPFQASSQSFQASIQPSKASHKSFQTLNQSYQASNQPFPVQIRPQINPLGLQIGLASFLRPHISFLEAFRLSSNFFPSGLISVYRNIV